MYITLTFGDTDITVDHKDETGASIGSPETYLLSDYKLRQPHVVETHIAIFKRGVAGSESDFSGFPYRAYPKDRVELVDGRT